MKSVHRFATFLALGAIVLAASPLAASGEAGCHDIRRVRALAAREGIDESAFERLEARHCSAPEPGSGGGGRGWRPGVAIHGSTDYCSGTPVAYVGPTTACSTLPSHQSSWSVRIGGSCFDIEDTSAPAACERFKTASRGSLYIHRSDYCSQRLVAAVTDRTECSELPRTGTDAWAVSRNGVCENISDMSPAQACERYRYAP